MHIGKWKIEIKDLIWFMICLVLIMCFFVGLFIYNKSCASSVLSGASTAISIVLSIVAILYTMIEGAHSSEINQDSINKLSSIDVRLKDVTEKLVELKDLDRKLRNTIPKVESTVQRIEEQYKENEIDLEVRDNLQALLAYVNEDIDD